MIVIPALIAVILFTASTYFYAQTRAPDPAEISEKNFIINSGDGVSVVGDKLQAAGLIKNSLLFKVVVKLERLDKNLEAGEYQLSPSMDAKTIAYKLTHGTFDISVTIPEGKRKEEIAELINNKLPIDTNEFISLAREGYLFPETYTFPKSYDAKKIIAQMEKMFQEKVKIPATLPGITFDQALTLASIVEREARLPEDRPVIAGILLKRLKNNWPIEADATTQYAVGFDQNEKTWWKNGLTIDDLKIKSPYNTRLNPGFPPGPICNPGLSAIEAALSPADSPYWFYLTDSKGKTHYARTLEDHNKNIALYLK